MQLPYQASGLQAARGKNLPCGHSVPKELNPYYIVFMVMTSMSRVLGCCLLEDTSIPLLSDNQLCISYNAFIARNTLLYENFASEKAKGL